MKICMWCENNECTLWDSVKTRCNGSKKEMLSCKNVEGTAEEYEEEIDDVVARWFCERNKAAFAS